MQAKSIKFRWRDEPVEVRPDAGRGILVDGWGTHCPSYLEPCELPELAPFRLPSMRYSDITTQSRNTPITKPDTRPPTAA